MGQSSIDTLKQIARGKVLYSTRSSAQCSEMTWARVTGVWQVVHQKVKCLRTVMDEIFLIEKLYPLPCFYYYKSEDDLQSILTVARPE